MSISIFGLGYVGSVMAACLASRGHTVIGVDTNAAKVEVLNSGDSPIVEERVQEFVREAAKQKRLSGTTDVQAAVRGSKISFICVGTPSLPNGKLSLDAIERVCTQIGEALRSKSEWHTVVLRSTVLPGTTESIVIPALEKSSGKRAGVDFGVCMNPEFLREATAVQDFFEPSITVVGARRPEDAAPVMELYKGLPGATYQTTIPTAEMVKYMCNAYHAVKVGFANEMASFGRELGVDVAAVTEIFCADKKLNISAAYLKPGFAFGGSCLPKDVRALTYRAKELDLELPLVKSILASNQEHMERAVRVILQTGKRNVGLLGLSFKHGTDDLRESPFVQVTKRLLGEGCSVKIWDKNVSLGMLVGANRQYINETIPHIASLLCETPEEVIQSAEVVLLGTNAVAAEAICRQLRPGQVLIDLLDLARVTRVEASAKPALV